MTNQRSRTSRRWTLTITSWTSSKFAFESQKRSIPCSTGRIRRNMTRNGCARRQRLWTSTLTLTIDPSASRVSPAFILFIDVNFSDDTVVPSKSRNKAHDVKLGRLKAELRGLLKQPLVARGVSMRYVTSGIHHIAHDILAGECRQSRFPALLYLSDTWLDHEGMIGVRRTAAGADVVPRKGRLVTKEHGVEFEEWTGITVVD